MHPACRTLKSPLARQLVLPHRGRQADRAGALAGRKDGAMRRLLDVLQELALGGARVAEQEHIDVSANWVLSLDILCLSAKKGQCNGRLDVLVSVNARRNRADNAHADHRVCRQRTDVADVVLRQAKLGKLVVPLAEAVDLDDGCKDGKAALCVQLVAKVVPVDAGHLDVLAGTSRVDQIPQEDALLVARQASGWDAARAFLQRDLLVIPVDRLGGIDRERAVSLTNRACIDADFGIQVLDEGPEDGAAFAAVVLDRLELRKDAGATRDNAGHADHCVDVVEAEIPQMVHCRKVGYPDMHLRLDSVVFLEKPKDNPHRCLVKDGQCGDRLVGDKLGQKGICLDQVQVADLEAFPVCRAHRADARVIDAMSVLVDKCRQEALVVPGNAAPILVHLDNLCKRVAGCFELCQRVALPSSVGMREVEEKVVGDGKAGHFRAQRDASAAPVLALCIQLAGANPRGHREGKVGGEIHPAQILQYGLHFRNKHVLLVLCRTVALRSLVDDDFLPNLLALRIRQRGKIAIELACQWGNQVAWEKLDLDVLVLPCWCGSSSSSLPSFRRFPPARPSRWEAMAGEQCGKVVCSRYPQTKSPAQENLPTPQDIY